MFSNRGSNFLAVVNLPEAQISKLLGDLGCSWTLNPADAPHFGGVWERKVGSVKRALEGAISSLRPSLSRDELETLFQESAAIINSTPLWAPTSSPDEPFPLCPTDLLIINDGIQPDKDGQRLPESDLHSDGEHRWKTVQYLAQVFWDRWQKEFIHTQRRRRKWISPKPSVKVGSVVLLIDEHTKRLDWRLGRVINAHSSHDGIIRRVDVKVISNVSSSSTRILTRPVHKLVLLLEP